MTAAAYQRVPNIPSIQHYWYCRNAGVFQISLPTWYQYQSTHTFDNPTSMSIWTSHLNLRGIFPAPCWIYEFRQFWRQKWVKPSTRKVYLFISCKIFMWNNFFVKLIMSLMSLLTPLMHNCIYIYIINAGSDLQMRGMVSIQWVRQKCNVGCCGLKLLSNVATCHVQIEYILFAFCWGSSSQNSEWEQFYTFCFFSFNNCLHWHQTYHWL